MFNRRNVVSFVFALLMVFFVTLCLSFECGYFPPDKELTLKSVVFAEIVIILSSPVSRICHITGFWLCGRLSGYKFISAEIFGFIFRKENGHITVDKYKYRKTVNVAMEPPEMKDGNYPFVLYKLGGVLIYSFLAVVLLILSFVSFFTWKFIASAFIFCAFSIFAANAVLYMLPVRKGLLSVFSLVRLLKKDELTRRINYKNAVITADVYKGIRFSEHKPESFEIPEGVQFSDYVRSELLFNRMWRFLDEKNFIEVKKLTDVLLDENTVMSENFRNYARVEKIFAEIMTENRENEIKPLLTEKFVEFTDNNQDSLSVLRLKYALSRFYYYNEREAELYKEKYESLSQISFQRYPADAIMDIELFELVKNK